MIQVVFETHSISEDNERGVASGWSDSRLSAADGTSPRSWGAGGDTRWALDHYLAGVPLEVLAASDFA